MKRLACLSVVVGCLLAGQFLALPARAADTTSNVTVHNRSDWDIHELYLSPTSEEEWGPDQLDEDVLSSGGSVTLTNVPCNVWDVMVVDEDGDECVIEQVELCAHEATWSLTNDELLSCEDETSDE